MLTDSDFIPYDPPGPAVPRFSASTWLLAGIGIVALIGSLANCWVLRESTRSSEARDVQWQRFHREVLGDLQELTHLAGLTTSHEMSPVRFRFRNEASSSPPPWLSGMARLSSLHDPEFSPRWEPVGTLCDFGLVPPGRYRLVVEMDEYNLEWEFDVFPGASVDRLVRYPLRTPREYLKLEVKADSGVPCRGGICIVKALPVVLGQWTWYPHEPFAAVADHRMSDVDITHLIDQASGLQQWLSRERIPLVGNIPFQVSEVCTAWLTRGREDSLTTPTTIHFGDTGDVRTRSHDSPPWPHERFHAHRPRLHWDRRIDSQPLVVKIPEAGWMHVDDHTHVPITDGFFAELTQRRLFVAANEIGSKRPEVGRHRSDRGGLKSHVGGQTSEIEKYRQVTGSDLRPPTSDL